MTYKAQLVVRARTKDGAAIIEKVKEMASEQDKTYSEMAVALLGRGLNADDEVEVTFNTPLSSQPEPSTATDTATSESSPVESLEQPEELEESQESEDDTPAHPRAPLPPEEAGEPVDPDLPPKAIVKAYLKRRDEKGERAAGRILVDFFAEAGPAEGGELKNLLQEEYTDAEFEELMEPIKKTDEYSEYTERAIFGEPSPYSEAR